MVRNAVSQNETNRYFVRSLVNGLQLLERFENAREGLTLMDLVRDLKWTKTSVFRYLATLSSLGYLEMDEASHRYRPTVKVLNLGYAALNALSLPELALPFLERLSQTFSESSSMGVLDGTDVVYVARVGSRRILAANLHVGSRLPAHCTSMGKALLAFLDDEERERLLERIPAARHTEKTITDPARLRQVLAEVRALGYSVNDQELDVGLWSCAVPVFGKTGKVAAAINLSTTSVRATDENVVGKFIPALKAASREITEVLRTKN